MDQTWINFFWYFAWAVAFFNGVFALIHWLLVAVVLYAGSKFGPGMAARLWPVIFDGWFVFYHVMFVVSVWYIASYW